MYMYLHFLSNDVKNSNKEDNSEHDCPMTASTTCTYIYIHCVHVIILIIITVKCSL